MVSRTPHIDSMREGTPMKRGEPKSYVARTFRQEPDDRFHQSAAALCIPCSSARCSSNALRIRGGDIGSSFNRTPIAL